MFLHGVEGGREACTYGEFGGWRPPGVLKGGVGGGTGQGGIGLHEARG